MDQPVILGFYGASNIGKTKAIIGLITFLRSKGFTVATIKKTDKPIMLDTPGKDTYRHGQAGACPVVLTSTDETTFIIHQPLPEQRIVEYLTSFPDLDVILIEGCTDVIIKKVKMDEKSLQRENTIFIYQKDKEKIKDYLINELERRRKS
jgi:molybdopterin-guanine dinucleotide biosynthesis adapter protein